MSPTEGPGKFESSGITSILFSSQSQSPELPTFLSPWFQPYHSFTTTGLHVTAPSPFWSPHSEFLFSIWAYFFLIFIYLFIYLWLCWVFVSVRGLSLVAASGGHSSSRWAGLSLSRPLLLRSIGSRCAGSVVVAHGPSRSAACGIFPDQGSNLCPLHWQADSQPLCHQGSPIWAYCSYELFLFPNGLSLEAPHSVLFAFISGRYIPGYHYSFTEDTYSGVVRDKNFCW